MIKDRPIVLIRPGARWPMALPFLAAGLVVGAYPGRGFALPLSPSGASAFVASSVLPAQDDGAGSEVRLPRARPDNDDSGAETEDPAAQTEQPLREAEGPVTETAEPAGEPEEPAAEALAFAAAAAASVAENVAEILDQPDPAPLPRGRPELTDEQATAFLSDIYFYGFPPDFRLKAALDAMDAGRYAEARAMAASHPDPLASALVDWLAARESDSGMTAQEIIDVLQSHEDWPEPERIRLQAERAFHAVGPDGDAVLAFYSVATPRTVGGKLALAGALREAGRTSDAVEIVRALWREDSLSETQANTVLTRFGSELRREDHVYRFRRLVLERQGTEANIQSRLLGPEYDRLATAVIASLDRDRGAGRLLDNLAQEFLEDPLYILGKARVLRRSGEAVEAARLILALPDEGDAQGEADAWWDERRDLSRTLLDEGVADLAYRIAASSHATGDAERTDAAFHAGWYALRYLDNAAEAEKHFYDLIGFATLPRTHARASYWLGRAFEAQGKEDEARLAYAAAGRFGGTFYGQLARVELGLVTSGLERTPKPSALDRMRFSERDSVRAVRLLAAAGHSERAFPFFRGLALTVETPGEVTLLVALAQRIGQPHAGTGAAAAAEQRGLAVASLPAPFLGVPPDLPLPNSVDRPLVYAVVRQESAFRPEATSHVGARGLMQLMPATARATAAAADLPFSVQRLTTDPLYNATLGAYHLGELLDRLDRSYILTFVAYNAGPGRVWEWIDERGDPRGGAVDPVDWIERIPFDETRNYVQRVMENLQVYRTRRGHPLSIADDLIRGGSEG